MNNISYTLMQSVYWEYLENQNLEMSWNTHSSSFEFVREVFMKIYVTYIVMMVSD